MCESGTDLLRINDAIASLMAEGWVGGPAITCCNDCARIEMLPLGESGKSCVWYTDVESWGDIERGHVTRPFRIYVLGDVHAVARRLCQVFGDRIKRVEPETLHEIGLVVVEPQATAQAMTA